MNAEAKKMSLLPAAPGLCSVCATGHGELGAHNYWSLFYQVHFKMRYGVEATHADTVAHLPVEFASAWRTALEDHGQTWSEPSGRDAIAEPYASRDQ